MIDVIIPTGISLGDRIVLAIVSDIKRTTPPAIAEVGYNILWSGPTIILKICGVIKPTNPIIPLTETLKNIP